MIVELIKGMAFGIELLETGEEDDEDYERYFCMEFGIIRILIDITNR